MSSRTLKPLSEERLLQVMREVHGNRAECAEILKDAGYLSKVADITELIKEFHAVEELFPATYGLREEAKPPQPKESAVREQPPAVQHSEAELQEQSDDIISKRGMKGAGISDEQIQRFDSMAEFVGHGFSKTVDFTYGVMVVGTMNLEERAKYIKEHILENEDEVEHTVFISKGGSCQPYKYTGPKYSPEIKLEFQREYNSIMDILGKYAKISNDAALTRVKAAEILQGKGNGKQKKKQKRLKGNRKPKPAAAAPASEKPARSASVEVVPQKSST